MKNQKIKITLLVVTVLALLVLSMTGCDNNSTSTEKTALASVTNLKAYSAGKNSVGLTWTASSSENVSDFGEYAVDVKNPAGTIVASTAGSKGDTSFTILNLTEGVIYTFEITTTPVEGSANYKNSSTVTVKWSPAQRLDVDDAMVAIKVYETSSSSSYGSGLILYHPTTLTPKVVSIGNPGADSSYIDLYLKTNTGTAGSVILQSASLFKTSWRYTRFSTVIRNVDNLDNAQLAPPDTSTYTLTSIQFDSTTTVSTSKIYYVKGDNGNYCRILVQRASNGTLIWGTTPEQYLNLKISFQTVAYNPYSKQSRKY
ncbi:MAG: fibronectin type III domain-containing protein [Ignavibacteriales bacterium]|nr:fibronectin type III domain-containing protein [Ignavibacteriales bacterium]